MTMKALGGLSEAEEEGLDVTEDDVVPLGVEVGHIVGGLEEETPESSEADVDATSRRGVEDGNAEAAADFLHGLNRLFVHRQRNVPRGDEANLGCGIFSE